MDFFLTFYGPKGTSFAHRMAFWEPPIGQKWVSDAYPVHIFQLDHYVVFGTKSYAVIDFQRGKKCPIGVKQTPSGAPQTSPNPPWTPQTPPETIFDCPYNQYNPSSYLITHQYSQNVQMSSKTKTMPKNGKKCKKVQKRKKCRISKLTHAHPPPQQNSKNWPKTAK